MTKEFCNYTQALDLKELGFDEPCFGSYDPFGSKQLSCSGIYTYGNCIAAPLYQQAFRFFREKHNLVFNFMSYSVVKPGEYHWSITWNDEAKAGGVVKTYEEAEQACLDKLIEILKQNEKTH